MRIFVQKKLETLSAILNSLINFERESDIINFGILNFFHIFEDS